MRKAMLLLAVLGLASLLWAADPIIGTWKLNLAKSRFAPTPAGQAAIKEWTEVYQELNAGQIEFTPTIILSDGSTTSNKWTWPRQGGVVKCQPPLPEEMSYIETVIEPGNWYVTVMRDGKQVGMIHKVISKDGKTMTQTTKSTDAQGKLYENVYDKQ